jgi:hypothetical protein
MALAALIVSIISLAIATAFAIRQERWQRETSRREERDRKHALELQRYPLEHDEGGWRRWGPGPPRQSE